jgi:hypothetical protein
MAIPEACGLWIEQRVKEELEKKGDTGSSLREIGRSVAMEIERLFEVKVNPGTIYHKARRFQGGTNAPETETPTAEGVSEEIKQIKREPAKDGTMRGGPREGSGSVSGGDIPNEHQNMTAAIFYEPPLKHLARV